MRIDEFDEFVEYGLLDKSLLIDTWRKLFEVHRGFDRLS
jgi:hypothetical protein